MNKFTRNVYLLFFFLSVVGASIIAGELYVKKQDLINKLKYEQLYVSYHFTAYLESIFSHYSTTVDLLSNTLSGDTIKDSQLLEKVLPLHPFLLAFALFDLHGKVVAQTLNLPPLQQLQEKNKLPGLKIAMQQSGLLIRKPFFFRENDQWIVPIFKRLINKQGHVFGVLVAGVDITTLTGYNSTDKMLGNNVHVSLADNNYSLFRTDIPTEDYLKFFSKSFAPILLKIGKVSQKKNKLTLEKLKETGNISQFFIAFQKQLYAYSFNYNKKYHLWINIFQSEEILDNKIYKSAFYYSLYYLLIMGIILVFCRSLIRLEKSKFKALNYEIEHDNLTHLYSRKMVLKLCQNLQQRGQPFALLYINLDNFKAINKSLGHDYGDALLIEVSKRLNRNKSNLSCSLCRYNADEFIVLIPNSDLSDVITYAKELLVIIAQPYKIKNSTLNITASIGGIRYPDDYPHLENLVNYANACMCIAKISKNNYQFFSDDIYKVFIKKIQIEKALHLALINNEINLVYQPQLDSDNNLYGVETLVRWQSKELGNVSPCDFIPIAEANSLMPVIGTYIMRTAIQEISLLQNKTQIAFSLSINVSVRQFMQSDFIETLLNAYIPYRSPLLIITIEITENLFIEDLTYLKKIFLQLKKHGINLALDDFGTGYSSLSLLRDIPLDELKIDKSFVDHIAEDAKDKAILKSIISMAKSLNLSVLAEGVETRQHVDILKELQCDIYQGFYFSKPLTIKELARFITNVNNSK